MANSTKQPPRRGKIKQMPNQNGAVAVEQPPEVAESPETPQTPFDPEPEAAEPVPDIGLMPPPHKSAGRPRTKGDFFDTVRKVAPEDWGTRVYLYLYCWEPICDEKLSGEKRYLNRYSQPILDEHSIMIDYGSGKYRLTLTNRKPTTTEKGSPIDTYDFEIYNPKYPPKIPRKVWKNDPRNARWEALLPPEQAPGTTPAIDPLAAFDTYMNIQDRIEDRLKPSPPATPTAVAPAPPDPFDTAKKIMDMRSNDPMIALFNARLDAADKAQEKARDREFELMKELRQQQQHAPSKGIADQLLELVPLLEKLKPVKEFFGIGTAGEAVNPARPGKMGAYEMVRDLAQTDFGRNLGQGLGILLANIVTHGAQANGQQQPTPPQPIAPVMSGATPNGTVPPKETDEQRIQRIGQNITQPMLYEYFLKDLSGEEFAERMFDLWPEDFIFIRKLGTDNLIERYRRFPQAWAVIAPKEPAFIEFIQEFCGWNEPPTEAQAADGGVTDLEEEEAGA
jgi:hypothetical protein